MAKMNFDELNDKIDALIKEGKIPTAQKEFLKINKPSIPRYMLTKFSNLARRCLLPYQSLHLFLPYVKRDRGVEMNLRPEESIEYGASLMRIGANWEAEQILAPLDGEKFPQAWLYRAFVHISTWDYDKSIPLLEKYVKVKSLNHYQVLIGEMNLATAYFYTHQLTAAKKYLKKLITEAKANEHQYLETEASFLMAQCYISENEFAGAKAILKAIAPQLESSPRQKMHAKKWNIIMQLKENHHSPQLFAELDEVLKSARDLGHWETIRSCHQIKAIYQNDEELMKQVYMGTPFKHLRQQMRNDFNNHFEVPPYYDWQLNGEQPGNMGLDVQLGVLIGKKGHLNPGQTAHRTLMALAQDFYRPVSIPQLHGTLFPGEFFNPQSSPIRAHMCIKRLRDWIEEYQLPLVIHEEKSLYTLQAKEGFFLRISDQKIAVTSDSVGEEAQFIKIGQFWRQNQIFSNKDVAQYLEIAPRTSSLLLKKLCDKGKVAKLGAGPSTRFKLVA